MPTRLDVTVTADADSLAVAVNPLEYLTAYSVDAPPKPEWGVAA
jgi:hypothetical protein